MTASRRKRADKPATGSKSQRLAPTPAADDAAKVEAPVTAPPVAETCAVSEGVAQTNPPDLDGDDKPGGSLQDIDWKCARTGLAAARGWQEANGLPVFGEWDDSRGSPRRGFQHGLAVAARKCMDDPAFVPYLIAGPDSWETETVNRLFAAVVRFIAL